MDRRLTGRDPLAYLGVEPSTPPDLVIKPTNPTANDGANYTLGTYWLTVPKQQMKKATGLFILISKASNISVWEQIWPAAANQLVINVDDDEQVAPVAGVLNFTGGDLEDSMLVINSTSPNDALWKPNFPLVDASNGLVFVGGVSGGNWTRLTEGPGVTIANDDGEITLSAPGAGGGGIATIHTDTEDVPEAVDNTVSIVGDGTFLQVTGNAAEFTATVTQIENPAITGNVTLSGTLTLSANAPNAVGVVVSSNVGRITSLQGAAGQFLQAQGGVNPPLWVNAAPGAGVIITTYNAPGNHNWVMNPNTRYVEVIAWGGGGGGGSGASWSTGTQVSGGSGGGSGGSFWVKTLGALITNPVIVTVGAGGAGGTAVANNSDGNPGGDGQTSSFGVMGTGIRAFGNHGFGGLTTTTSPGGSGANGFTSLSGSQAGITGGSGGVSTFLNGVQGDNISVAGINLSNSAPVIPITPAGGASGGGRPASGDGTSFGGIGGSIYSAASINMIIAEGGIAGSPGAGGNAQPPIAGALFLIGGAGGGGGSATTEAGFVDSNGFAGGNGGFPGGGGGGGGAGTSGNTSAMSGAGGNGGNGQVIVIEYL